ncbi:MAG: MFS transporter [Candidatus Nezhaarchaeota archaeon]|nr:MFS transporter [Candidatus Nezhaarchaeota archaeon]
MIRRILVVFVLLGLISLLADMVYEGARSVSGAYLEHLEAPPVASAIIGVGELIGYFFRFVSGILASYLGSSAILWGFVALGYTMNAMVLPFLAFAGSWWIASSLYLLERVGKGLRTPLRDVILAEVTEGIGRGKGFGLHEVMDQVGALAGPLFFAYMLIHYDYPKAFLALLIPGTLAMMFVFTASFLYPKIKSIEVSQRKISFRGLGKRFWLYTLSMNFQSLGFVHWAIASYFLKHWEVLGDAEIAVLYAIAMGIDALVAFPIGHLYDVMKFKSLYIAPIATLVTVLLLTTRITTLAYVMAVLWGITMGVSETIMRASIVDIVHRDNLAMAYGTFGMLYGISWSIGGFIMTLALQLSASIAIIHVVLTQAASLLTLTFLTIRSG